VRRSVLPALLALAGLGGFAPAFAAQPSPPSKTRPAEPSGPDRPWRVTEQREPCATWTPTRRAFFGDTHVHTTHSQDASTQDTRITPAGAYRFAKGEPLAIQPYDDEGRGQRVVRLRRPLDFAIVTDHAEQLGETHICKTPGLPGHGGWVCRMYRSLPRMAFFVMNANTSLFKRRFGFCGKDGERCLAAAATVWDDIQQAAEDAYDRRSSCAFTSFVGYEWTSSSGGTGSHLHRNVVFRNERVPALPVSALETGFSGLELWRRLERECEGAGRGCEALTIPHNSNLGRGSTFTSAAVEGAEITAEETPLRVKYERLVEIMQHKGDSECALRPGGEDEVCAFETVVETNKLPFAAPRTTEERIDYVRTALLRGLALSERLDANPLQLGVLASTDTHLGTPGLVAERGHPGHGGAGPYMRDGIRPGLPDDLRLNPGGLAVLWAEENTRDALFAAMRRREAYGTSGTRPLLRFFGGWDYPADLCEEPDVAAAGYAGGVPMGGELPARPGEAAPTFVLSALRDPDAIAAPLQRIDLVKGWVEDGELRERVLAVAGGPNEADVDLATCERRGAGHDRLCTVWRDPDFDPARPAFYYARVLENPSCRWSQWACVDAGVDCADPETVTEGFEPCCAEAHVRTIQERAWSSPVWYSPREGAASASRAARP